MTLSLGKILCWYMGIQEKNIEHILNSNSHTVLITDEKQKDKFLSFTNTSMIPLKYKSGKDYYKNYEIDIKNSNSKILQNHENISLIIRQVFLSDISPGLADSENLIG